MKTKSELFVEKNRDNWNTLRNLVIKISKRGIKSINKDELKLFPGIYRKTCQDLAQARMLKLSPDVLEYLNNLTAKAHEQLYYMRPLTIKEFTIFFTKILPSVILKNYIYFLVSFFIFAGSGITTFYLVNKNPEFAYKVIKKENLEAIADMHSEIHNEGRDVEENSLMSAYYIQHNISIGFLSFATGIFLGLGTLYLLLFNGIYLGCIFSHLKNVGYGGNLLHFVTAHSFLELTGLVIAGAAGLLLGLTVLKSWKSYSKDILIENKNRILTLMSAAFFMIGTAAFIEAFVSPSSLDYKYKFLTLIITAAISIFYYFIYPFIRRSSENQ